MKTILALFFILVSLSSSAQKKITESIIGWKPGEVTLETLPGKDMAAILVLGPDSIKTLVLDSNEMIIAEFPISRKGYHEKYLGGFISNKNIYVYTNNGNDAGIRCWVFNLADKSARENIVPFKTKKDKGVGYVSTEKHFCYLTINKSSADFVIYDFKDETNYDTIHFTTAASLNEKNKKNVLFYAPHFSTDLGNINMPGECDADIASHLMKIYTQANKIFFVTNKVRSLTCIYEFDIENRKLSYHEIQHNHSSDAEQSSVENSFLSGDRLYYVSATMKGLFLQVVDFYSERILKEFHVKEDDEIKFKNTAVIFEGAAFGGEKELGKTKQLLRKMTNGGALISAYPDSNKKYMQLIIGSYAHGYSVSSGTIPVGGVAGSVTTSSVSGSWSKSARFKSLIDPVTAEYIPGQLSLSVNDRIEIYNTGIKKTVEAQTLFIKNNKYYYTYYDGKARSVNLVKFEY